MYGWIYGSGISGGGVGSLNPVGNGDGVNAVYPVVIDNSTPLLNIFIPLVEKLNLNPKSW